MKLLLSLLVPLVSARVVRVQQEVPVKEVEEAIVDGARGIGIHLTTSYATAAVRYPDGTVEDLVRVEGDAKYIELMSRWADLKSNTCDSSSPDEALLCELQKAAYQIKKDPEDQPSPDVAVLSSFLSDLKIAIESKLGSLVTNVFPVLPAFVAIEREEDIEDALTRADLSWPVAFYERDQWKHVSSETNAAFAALGFGLCETWVDTLECAKQQGSMPFEHVLYLNFDNFSFSATLQYMQNAYQQWFNTHALDTSLGWWNLPVYEVPRARFWAQLHEVILDVAGALQRPPNKIVLMGEHAGDNEFMGVVKTALFDLYEFDVSLLVEANAGVDGGTLAARGAAELAARAEYWNMHSEPPQDTEVMEL